MAKTKNTVRLLKGKIPSLNERMAWFRQAKFGMFIHWGLYSILGRHEWVMNRERIPLKEYEALAKKFTAEKFDPKAWARLAREAGQKYVALTTKHHEGFCLFDSKLTKFTSVNSPARRDIVAEFVEAVRAEGLHVGLYYSLMDWHHPDGANCLHDLKARKRFVDYTHGLVSEIMTNYGKIDYLFYDVPWPLKPNGWDSTKLNYMVRSLQPDILINNRSGWGVEGSLMPEDFDTPENSTKASASYRDWESCDTLNGSWGWNKADKEWKSVPTLLGKLVSCAGNGGNLILNVGPRGDGSIEEEAISSLRGMGDWLKRNNNGESIYGTERVNTEWMNFNPHGTSATAKGNTMYWHITRWYGKELWLGGLQMKVRNARIVSTGEKVKFKQTFKPTERLHLYDLPVNPPDKDMTVIALECASKPSQRLGAGHVWIDGVQ